MFQGRFLFTLGSGYYYDSAHTVKLPRQAANAQRKLHRGATLPPFL